MLEPVSDPGSVYVTQTGRQTDGQTDRQTERQTDRQSDRAIETEMGAIQIGWNRYTGSGKCVSTSPKCSPSQVLKAHTGYR